MKIVDFGRHDGPLVLFGGPYSNLQATQALLAHARSRGIAPAATVCTGDVVAYCGAPAATVAALRAAGCPVVAGNCEKQLAAGAGDCGCGFAPGSTCDRLSARWYSHADAALGPGDRAWMAGLPDIGLFTHRGGRFAVIHGGATDVARFLWPTSPDACFAEEIAAVRAAAGPVDGIVAGHCGIPFTRRVAGVAWINAGVIGMPPNDGAPQTRFAVLAGGAPRIERLTYDHAGAAATMRAAGLTQGYDRGLATGYWPSEDVLPPDLRRAACASG
ncbi:metallophosphoesterase family protein [Roseovarius salinarum]|uniref:metallophosphoesterase family protein n=1 Tax=Roseovarius salinarum TaxID=1981892 RepID=UPI000C34EE9C|nr:metallophosphoesterase family protein [Roseovarius salinarum]